MVNKKFSENELMQISDLVEEKLTIEDTKAMIAALLEVIFEADIKMSTGYMKKYLDQKKSGGAVIPDEMPDSLFTRGKSNGKK